MTRIYWVPFLLPAFWIVAFSMSLPAPARSDSSADPQAGSAISLQAQSRPWSRQLQEDKYGYYDQAACLCEDYPIADRTQARLDQDFKIIRWTGAKALRVGISWLDVEPQPGLYDWTFWDRLVDTAARNHIALLPYVCYTPGWAALNQEDYWRQPPSDPAQFAQFMHAIASRYKGRVFSWELWNEPDNPDFWIGSVEQYAQMVRAGAAATRQADPRAVVVLGGMADAHLPFLKTLIDRYDIDKTVDVINIHGYFQTWNSHPIEDYTSYIDNVARELTGPSRPDLWMAEFGYSNLRPFYASSAPDPTFYGYEHTRDYQAAMLFKSQVIALATGRLSLTAWYRIRDLKPDTDVIGDDNNRFFGIAYVDGSLKPAAYALRFYNRLFDRPTRCIDRVVPIESVANSQSEVHVFEQQGRLIVVGWLRSTLPGEIRDRSGNAPDDRAETVSIQLPPGGGGRIDAYNVTGSPISVQAKLDGSKLTGVSLSGQYVFVATLPMHGDAEQIEQPVKN